MSLEGDEERNKALLVAVCERLRNNDPSLTCLYLDKYGKIEWKDAVKIAKALDRNTILQSLDFYLDESSICSEGTVPFIHFLRASQSLRTILLAGGGSAGYNHTATSVLEAISYSKSLSSLTLRHISLKTPEALEELLASTRTLKKLKLVDSGSTREVAQALRRGLERNQTLEKLHMEWKGEYFFEEVIVGLTAHAKMNRLFLDFALATEVSGLALRFFLKGNETLEKVVIRWESNLDKFSTVMTPILLGLACNRSVKKAEFSSPVLNDSQTPACAAAWTEMLQRNQTMEVLQFNQVFQFDRERKMGPKCAASIAKGLCENTTLQELDLGTGLQEGAFHGPSWERMLDRNRSLMILNLASCFVGDPGAESLGRGLSRNTSLKELNLASNGIGNSGATALADSLRSNKVLEFLNLAFNGINGPEAVIAIKSLWECRSLTRLDLTSNAFVRIDSDITMFPEGLPKNTSFERLDLDCCHLNSASFLAIIESLKGIKCLREVHLADISVSLDDSCGAALKQLLESTSLCVLNLGQNKVTSEGMTELVEGLQHSPSLKELALGGCEVNNEELFKLGEGLVENKTLEHLDLRSNSFDAEGLSVFFRFLPRMKGLKKLELNSSSISNETVGSAILDGIRVNTSLEIIEGIEERELSTTVKKSIDFYLQMNRNGRRYLQAPLAKRMPLGAWPHILTKLSPVSEQDQLFYFLRHKADLVADGPASLR